MTITALINAEVLVEQGFRKGFAVLVENGRIADVVSAGDARVRAAQTHDLHGMKLVPGFIDTQVNGGGGVLFNDEPTVDAVRRIAQAHRRFGTTGMLPTLISDDAGVMRRAIAAIDAAIEQRVPGVLGIHLEGPYLAPARKGVHDASKFRVPDAAEVAMAASLRNGKTLLTLAPDRVPADVIRDFIARGVVVAAGHTAASYEETRAALDLGVRGFTHLYNAMTPLASREPGVVGAALADAESWCGVIVDGHHVHAASLRVALAAKPRGKILLVTDAMPPVGSDSPSFRINGQIATARDGLLTVPDGTLAGSVLDMAQAVRNTVAWLDVPLDEAVRMAATYPAEFIGLGATHGRIAPGYAADLVALDAKLGVAATWIAGSVEEYA
ncbi:MAG: N-acetylglucosamine-6-phosphate deacetylase [Proteobacteria bacterium]|uniref:N-acetylglucosamine-6-phosphate deacetylase n=1 Tax=Rudaea sp. TaxID=2136325 RepID=UPI00322058E2|nr:N-acetylglucosamine-6-phosphate deacetylase [Pseudomonadota bacterium]